MLTAVSAGMLIVGSLLLALVAGSQRKSVTPPVQPRNEGIVIRSIELPKVELKQPEEPKQPEKTTVRKKAAPVATIRYTTPPKIKRDTEVKQVMPEQAALDNKTIATTTTDGKPADGKVEPVEPVTAGGNTEPVKTEAVQPAFNAEEKDPLFPGGMEALKQFMARNLGSPGALENGEKVLVQVRFVVDKDGTVSHFEIIKSGGSDFDKEVVRVCRKMPRWIPASQNGINVPVNYVLPVTFIGTEG